MRPRCVLLLFSKTGGLSLRCFLTTLLVYDYLLFFPVHRHVYLNLCLVKFCNCNFVAVVFGATLTAAQAEIDEMVDLYKEKGFTEEEAKKILDIMSRNKEFFVDHMLVQARAAIC